jgi:hypothetical protein
MKHIKLFEQFLNEASSQDEKKYNTFIDIFNDEFDGEDFKSLKIPAKAKGITVVLFSELKKYKDFPKGSVIFTPDTDPNEYHLFSSDLQSMSAEDLEDQGFEFTNYSDYVNMYGSYGPGNDGVAFIF